MVLRRYLEGYLLLCALTLFAPWKALADSWARPQTREVFSESRQFFVRVVPGESLGDTMGFAGEKKGKYASAEFYRRAQDRSYKLTAQVFLLNPVAPVEFFVSEDGRLATLDNWHNLGYGMVVSLYDSQGRLVKSYELSDLFQTDEVKDFSHSVSSVHWRKGPAYIRPDQKTLLVTVKSGADLLFGLETGRYKYCEYHETVHRCRNTNQPRQWLSNDKLPLSR
jgi:hypothetical protein